MPRLGGECGTKPLPPLGQRQPFLARLLCQAAQAAVHKKGSYLQSKFRKLVVRLGYQKAVWAIAHRLCRIIWNVLRGSRFIEHGEAVSPRAVRRSIQHHLTCLRRLGYCVPQPPPLLA